MEPEEHYDAIKAELDALEAAVGVAAVLPLHNALAAAWRDYSARHGNVASRDGGHKPPPEDPDA